jgi:predicted ribosome quality control (RQC) complex YloA/Tae2 family protein
MAMRDAELARVVESLQRHVGGQVGGAWQPSRDRVVLEVGGQLWLLVPRGSFARFHSVSRRPKNPPKPFSFQGALRARLGGRLEALDKHPHDRVVDLQFTRGRLHLRLTGSRGGLWLMEDDQALAAYDGPAPAALPPLPVHVLRSLPTRFEPAAEEHWDVAARRWFGRAEAAERNAQKRAELLRGLRRELERNRRLARNLDEDLDRSARAPLYRRQADALAAMLHRVPRVRTLSPLRISMILTKRTILL